MLKHVPEMWRLGQATLRQTLPVASQLLHGASMLHPSMGWPGSRRLFSKQLSFQEKKMKVLGQEPEEQAAQPTAEQNAVMVQPNQGPASIQQVANVLNHSALIITRPIEWGNIILGYEQAQRYTVYDQDGVPVAQLMEDYQGFANEVGRQLLRKRRSFTATVFSADGSQIIFRLRRPAYLINSSLFIEDGEGRTIGEIQQRWHPIKRNYDLYLGQKQFAKISGTFLAWEFELQDDKGSTLALIDRNFQGFGKEIFTDAGKYVVHFGAPTTYATAAESLEAAAATAPPPELPLPSPQAAQEGAPTAAATPTAATPTQTAADAAITAAPTAAIPTPAPATPAPTTPAPATPATPASAVPTTPAAGSADDAAGPPITAMAQMRTGVPVIPTQAGNQLAVTRPIALDERMAVLAAAISVDYDYFSSHSHHGAGWVPPIFVPMPGSSAPIPTGDVAGPPPAGAPGADGGMGRDLAGGAGAGAAHGTASQAMASPTDGAAPPPPSSFSSETHLGGDEFNAPKQSDFGQGEEMKWDLPETPSAGGDGGSGGLLGSIWDFVKDSISE